MVKLHFIVSWRYSIFLCWYGRHVFFKCEVKKGVLTSILPGFVDIIRKNPYIDKNISEIQDDINHADNYVYEEEAIVNITDPDDLDNNIRNPLISVDYFLIWL